MDVDDFEELFRLVEPAMKIEENQPWPILVNIKD